MKYTPRVALFGDYYTSDRLGPPILCHHHIQAAEGWLTCYNADDSQSCGLGSWPPGQQMASTITSCGSSSKYQQAPSVAVATGSSQRIFQRFPRSLRICSGIAALQYISTHTIDQKQAANEEEDEYIPSCLPSSFSSPRRTKASETEQRKAGNIGKMLLLSTEGKQMATKSQP